MLLDVTEEPETEEQTPVFLWKDHIAIYKKKSK